MAVVYLLSAAEFKARTPVHGNVDEKFIQQSILACQDLYVTEIVGTNLYNKLISDVAASSLTGSYKTLLQDYLHKGMRYWIMSELPYVTTIRITNSGAQEKYTSESNAADIADMNTISDKWSKWAQTYAEKTRLYLCANAEEMFPEYLTSGDTVDDVTPAKTVFKSSIYLGNGKEDCCEG